MQYRSLSTLCLALIASGAFAQAKPPEPDYTLGFNLGAVSDYRFRGISQTSFDPALQAGAGVGNYTDYSLSLAKDFGNRLMVSAAAIGSDARRAFYTNPPDGKNLGQSTVVVGLKYNI